MISKRVTGSALLLAIAALVLVPVTAATAASSSATTFAASASQSVSFGSDWVMPIAITTTTAYQNIDANSGSVDVFIKGQPGTYASHLPLTAGGVAYFSPPDSKAPLGAGTYQVTAVFVPAANSGLSASQTTKAAVITVSALNLSTSMDVKMVTIDNDPGAQLVLGVKSTTADQLVPSGSWNVTATASGGSVAYSKSTAVRGGSPTTTTTVQLAQNVKPGRTYTVQATFVPSATVRSGYAVKNPAARKVDVSSPSIVQVLSNPVNLSFGALVAISIVLLLLIVAAIVLLVRRPKAAMVR